MEITKEQYEAAKKIVEVYERQEWEDGQREAEAFLDDDLEDDDEEYSDPLESEFEHCTCGAYVLSDKGNIIKISDCYC